MIKIHDIFHSETNEKLVLIIDNNIKFSDNNLPIKNIVLDYDNEIDCNHISIDKVFNKYKKYKHFKGGIYKAYCIAYFNNTKDKYMIYQNISPEQKDKYLKIYARPLKMFNSLVDKEKYPNVNQKYRFKLIEEE